jgi:hypothetical protein
MGQIVAQIGRMYMKLPKSFDFGSFVLQGYVLQGYAG